MVGRNTVDTTKGYNITVVSDGSYASVKLKRPVIQGETQSSVRFLAEVNDGVVSAKPDCLPGEEIGAISVETIPGLYYQASWGDDLGNLSVGEKVLARTDTLYLGVIKQTGKSGFYKVTVSEQ